MKNPSWRTLTVVVLALSMCSLACGPDAVGGPTGVVKPPPQPPDRTITALEPARAVAGGGDLRVTIHGTGFDGEGVLRSIAYWFAGGTSTALASDVVSSTELSVLVPAALVSIPGAASIAVALRDFVEQSTVRISNHLEFTIVQRQPQITSLEPASAMAGSGDVTVRILGFELHRSWHIRSLAVWLDGQEHTPLATTVISSTELTAVIPASLLSAPRSAAIRVELSDVMEGIPEGRTTAFPFAVE